LGYATVVVDVEEPKSAPMLTAKRNGKSGMEFFVLSGGECPLNQLQQQHTRHTPAPPQINLPHQLLVTSQKVNLV